MNLDIPLGGVAYPLPDVAVLNSALVVLQVNDNQILWLENGKVYLRRVRLLSWTSRRITWNPKVDEHVALLLEVRIRL